MAETLAASKKDEGLKRSEPGHSSIVFLVAKSDGANRLLN